MFVLLFYDQKFQITGKKNRFYIYQSRSWKWSLQDVKSVIRFYCDVTVTNEFAGRSYPSQTQNCRKDVKMTLCDVTPTHNPAAVSKVIRARHLLMESVRGCCELLRLSRSMLARLIHLVSGGNSFSF